MNNELKKSVAAGNAITRKLLGARRSNPILRSSRAKRGIYKIASAVAKAMADRSDALAMKSTLILLLTLVLIASACNQKTSSPATSPTTSGYSHLLQIGNQKLNVEIANTRETMELGLSYRKSLGQNQGMLFDFSGQNNNGVTPAFWMKGMNFNLDFIWIFKNKIIGITPDVPAPVENLKLKIENLPNYYPPSPVDWVLEVNTGWAKKNSISVGDVARIQN